MRVLLDAGHGGNDAGAVSAGVQEKNVSLELVLAIGKVLDKLLKHVDVGYTRTQDKSLTLYERHRLIRVLGPDAFISIHCNSYHSDNVKGFEIFYRSYSDHVLANYIYRLIRRSDLWDRYRGVKQDKQWLNKNLTVLNNLDIPSCLVEVGFLSNDREREMIINNIAGIADLIGHGIVNYFEELSNV